MHAEELPFSFTMAEGGEEEKRRRTERENGGRGEIVRIQ